MRWVLLFLLILLVGLVHAARVTVGPSEEDYTTIQKAIDNSSDGDIIEVHSGTYAERLRVRKSLTLMGLDTGGGLPVINASGSSSAIILMANGSTVMGFNLTGSGRCACGSAGVQIDSSNNTIRNNILYKNKYGVYVTEKSFNNTIFSNDFLENNIAASDFGNNSWAGSPEAEGLLERFAALVRGKKIVGNYYSDYNDPDKGCNDTNKDGFCDMPREIHGGFSLDPYPSTTPFQISI